LRKQRTKNLFWFFSPRTPSHYGSQQVREEIRTISQRTTVERDPVERDPVERDPVERDPVISQSESDSAAFRAGMGSSFWRRDLTE